MCPNVIWRVKAKWVFKYVTLKMNILMFQEHVLVKLRKTALMEMKGLKG